MRKIALILLLPLFSFAKEEAAKHPWPDHQFAFTSGLSYHDSSIKIGTKSGAGFILETEDALGLDTTQNTFRLDYNWRFTDSKRHAMTVSWYQYHRENTKTLLEDIKYEDEDGNEVTLPVGTKIRSVFNFDIIKLIYSYSFFQDDRIGLNIGGGLHVMPMEMELAKVGDENTKNSFIAPLPTFLLRGVFILNKKWMITTEANFFYLAIDKFSGGLFSTSSFVEYNVFDNLHLGLGFEDFAINLKVDDDSDISNADLDGAVEISNKSLLLRLRYTL